MARTDTQPPPRQFEVEQQFLGIIISHGSSLGFFMEMIDRNAVTHILFLRRCCRLGTCMSPVAVALLVSACAIQPQSATGPRGALPNDGSSALNTHLLEVYVPGAVLNRIYDSPNRKLDPLLNPRTPAPPFKESGEINANCLSSTKLDFVDDHGSSLADEPRFHQLMAKGRQIAEARHVWQFNKERNEAQLKKISGPRTNPRGEGALPRSSSVPQRNSAVQAGSILPSVADSLSPNAGRSRLGMVTSEEANRLLPNFSKMRDDLTYNAQILTLQDEELKTQEGEHTEELMTYYQDAFLRLSKVPGEQISLAALNRFERFRFSHIYTCARRGKSTEQSDKIALDVQNQYISIARRVIESNRTSIIQAIKSAKSSSALQAVYRDMLNSDFLLALASQNQALAQNMQQRSSALLAQEAREREDEANRAKAEAARKEMLTKKTYLNNAAKNISPTKDEIGRLLSTYESEIDQDLRKFRIERTGPESFIWHANIPIFGEIKVGMIETGISNLTCKPEQSRQRCSFSENRMITAYNLGLYTNTTPSSRAYEAVFFWDASGLHSPDLRSILVKRTKDFLAELEARSSNQNKTCRNRQSWYRLGNTTLINEYCE